MGFTWKFSSGRLRGHEKYRILSRDEGKIHKDVQMCTFCFILMFFSLEFFFGEKCLQSNFHFGKMFITIWNLSKYDTKLFITILHQILESIALVLDDGWASCSPRFRLEPGGQ